MTQSGGPPALAPAPAHTLAAPADGQAGADPAPRAHVALQILAGPQSHSCRRETRPGYRASQSKFWGSSGSMHERCQIPPATRLWYPGSHRAARKDGTYKKPERPLPQLHLRLSGTWKNNLAVESLRAMWW